MYFSVTNLEEDELHTLVGLIALEDLRWQEDPGIAAALKPRTTLTCDHAYVGRLILVTQTLMTYNITAALSSSIMTPTNLWKVSHATVVFFPRAKLGVQLEVGPGEGDV